MLKKALFHKAFQISFLLLLEVEILLSVRIGDVLYSAA